MDEILKSLKLFFPLVFVDSTFIANIANILNVSRLRFRNRWSKIEFRSYKIVMVFIFYFIAA